MNPRKPFTSTTTPPRFTAVIFPVHVVPFFCISSTFSQAGEMAGFSFAESVATCSEPHGHHHYPAPAILLHAHFVGGLLSKKGGQTPTSCSFPVATAGAHQRLWHLAGRTTRSAIAAIGKDHIPKSCSSTQGEGNPQQDTHLSFVTVTENFLLWSKQNFPCVKDNVHIILLASCSSS